MYITRAKSGTDTRPLIARTTEVNAEWADAFAKELGSARARAFAGGGAGPERGGRVT